MITTQELWWVASRATGLVATALLLLSLVGGLFFSARNTGWRRSPAWWLDLHNLLGGLALAMTGLHVLTAYLDANSGIGIAQVIFPGASRFSITWGVLATYLLVAVVATSWPTRRLGRTWWRVVHVSSIGAVVLAVTHAYQTGTDRNAAAFQLGLLCTVALGVYAVAVRTLGLVLRSRTPIEGKA